ncbi:MAG: hypothetical protein R2686_07070 [Candidatus Nanopelagicales bacterium]
MTNDSLPWLVWGRQVRPGAFWLSIVTALLGINAVLGRLTHVQGVWSDVAGVAALLSAGALWAGFWGQSSRAMSGGLLGACWSWAFLAFSVIQATGEFGSVSCCVAACWSGLAATLWLRDRRE